MSPLFMAGNLASIVGFVFAALTLRWVARVLNAFGLLGLKVGTPPGSEVRVAGLAALLLHPAPWILLIGVLGLIRWAIAEPDAETRVVVVSWSLGTYLVVVAFAIRAILRQSKRPKVLEAKE